MKVVMVRTI